MISNLRRLKAARPFVPFAIRTADGETLRVPTTDHIAVSPRGGRAVVFAEDGGAILLSSRLISLIAADPT